MYFRVVVLILDLGLARDSLELDSSPYSGGIGLGLELLRLNELTTVTVLDDQ